MRSRVRRRARAGEGSDEIQRAVLLRGMRGPTLEGNYSTCCPFCPARSGKVDDDYKLTFKYAGLSKEGEELSLARGVFNCYRCGARGYADFTWIGVTEEEPAALHALVVKPDLGPPEGFTTIEQGARSLSMRGFVDYFRRRGVLDQAIAAGAGACLAGRYAGRVVVPHRARGSSEWLGFAARATGAQQPKYLYPAGMDRRNALWGARFVRGVALTYVVEGVFDALPLFPHAVATLGKSVTQDQIEALVALQTLLVPCFDGDAWTDCRALAARLQLAGGEVAGWCHLPPGEDPGTLGWAVRDFFQPTA